MKRFNLMMILSAAILVTGAVIAHAQRSTVSPVDPLLPGVTMQIPNVPLPQAPSVITGADFGFRVERMDGNRPVGELVIRQNSPAGGTVWVPVELGGAGVRQLTLK
jgi:hypothetical protein